MLGDLKFCFMFVILCLSVYFRNVGCCHVPVLGPVEFAQGSEKEKVWRFRFSLNFSKIF